MQKRALIRIARRLAVICVLLNLSACAGTYTPTDMLKKFFLLTVNPEQSVCQADADNLSEDPISLLNGRIYLRMPEGAVHPTEHQQQLLHVPELDGIRNKDEVIWAGSNEILKIVAIESLRFVDEDWDATNATMIFEPDKEDLYSLKRNYYDLLTVHVRTPDETRIVLYFSLYTLGGKERVDFFSDVAKAVAATIIPERALDMRAQTIEWEGLVFETQEGYYVEKLEDASLLHPKHEIIIHKIMPNEHHTKIYMEIVDATTVNEEWENAIVKPDTILEQQMQWQYISDDFGVRAVGIVKFKTGKKIKLSIVAADELSAKELFGIVHTLKKK